MIHEDANSEDDKIIQNIKRKQKKSNVDSVCCSLFNLFLRAAFRISYLGNVDYPHITKLKH
jgi:hypothetical protein